MPAPYLLRDLRLAIAFAAGHHRPDRADDQHLAQVLVPSLGDSAKPLLAAARVLPRHKANPRDEVAT